jgi:molybdenum cofactor cytidylyltransferase
MTMKGIGAIILAAGESKRMGSPKMLLPFKDKTVIETVIENVLAAGIEETRVVLGAYRDDILKIIGKYQIGYCVNEDYKTGMLSSVQHGFASLPYGCRAALVMPGDKPMIEPQEIIRVIEAYLDSGKGLVMPVYKKKRGHPLVVDASYFEEVLNLPEAEGLRRLSIIHPDDVYEVKTDDPGVLHDVDTREDYLLAINKI